MVAISLKFNDHPSLSAIIILLLIPKSSFTGTDGALSTQYACALDNCPGTRSDHIHTNLN